MFGNRDLYRSICKRNDLVSYQITVKETNLFIMTDSFLEKECIEMIIKHRGYIESYIESHPMFATTLVPWPDDPFAPPVVRAMIESAKTAGVGPMAAVAGAVSEFVGNDLTKISDSVMVENGGDIYIKSLRPVTVAIFAGNSPLSGKIGLRITAPDGLGVCTSSGTVGHSLSFGKADAICMVSSSCSLADAAATAIGNIINRPGDIQPAMDKASRIIGVKGALAIIGKHLGAWGDIEIVPV